MLSPTLIIVCALVVTVSGDEQKFTFPTGEFDQQALLSQTIQAILKYKEELERHPDLFQAEDGDANLTVPEVIERHNYPVEIHQIETEDGYLLEAHRIPSSLKCDAKQEEEKRVVWLQHGLMGDSSNWVITGPNQRGLAFELADACYDVFLGNFRGNTYSKNHKEMNSSDPKFWDFSFHEVGISDVTANIDYALQVTGAKQLFYIGHSMGTTTFFVAMSERPEYNEKVKLFSALAPVTFQPNLRSLLVRIILPFLDYFLDKDRFPNYQVVLPIEWTKELAQSMCRKGAQSQELCVLIYFLLGGFNKAQIDLESLPAILGHAPAGSSSKVMLHYGQSISTGDFRQFDYGAEINLEKYGNTIPPDYDLSKVVAPTAIYYGDNDFLADKTDVLKSLLSFANSTIVRVHRVEDKFFNHLDFIFALDQHVLINKPVMDFMEEFTNPKPPPTQIPGKGSRIKIEATFPVVAILVLYCFFKM